MLFNAIRKANGQVVSAVIEPPFIPFDLIAAAEKKLTTSRPKPIPNMATTYRVSGLSRMCPREEVLRNVHKIEAFDKVDAKLQRTFDFGHGFHHEAQNKWFGSWGWLEGDWLCTSCGTKHIKQLRPSNCKKCNDAEHFEYIELELESVQHFLTGHPDGILLLGNVRYLLELKTSNTKYYQYIVNTLGHPLDAHLDQVNIYMFLLGLLHTIVIYLDKDTSDWKQFYVKYDKARVDRLLAKIQEVKDGIQLGSIPPRKMCEKSSCARAMGCSTRNQCFN